MLIAYIFALVRVYKKAYLSPLEWHGISAIGDSLEDIFGSELNQRCSRLQQMSQIQSLPPKAAHAVHRDWTRDDANRTILWFRQS